MVVFKCSSVFQLSSEEMNEKLRNIDPRNDLTFQNYKLTWIENILTVSIPT